MFKKFFNKNVSLREQAEKMNSKDFVEDNNEFVLLLDKVFNLPVSGERSYLDFFLIESFLANKVGLIDDKIDSVLASTCAGVPFYGFYLGFPLARKSHFLCEDHSRTLCGKNVSSRSCLTTSKRLCDDCFKVFSGLKKERDFFALNVFLKVELSNEMVDWWRELRHVNEAADSSFSAAQALFDHFEFVLNDELVSSFWMQSLYSKFENSFVLDSYINGSKRDVVRTNSLLKDLADVNVSVKDLFDYSVDYDYNFCVNRNALLNSKFVSFKQQT